MQPMIPLFFPARPAALSLYQCLEEQILRLCPDTQIKVQKTQITFSNKHGFAFVSLPRCKTKKKSKGALIVTFGLSMRVLSPRIMQAVEPYPNRWTHHVLVERASEIDGELLGWIQAAAQFSAEK